MQAYIKTDRQLHWLSQVIAKTNRTYVPEKSDDSHTNLYFDHLGKRITGRWMDGPDGKIMLNLDLKSMGIKWINRSLTTLHEVAVFNSDMGELEQKAGTYLQSLGMNTEGLSKPLHFEIPDYQIEKIDEGDISSDGLKSWIWYRELANRACPHMLGYLQMESEIRIWPHHFDTGIYLQVSENLGLGFGLAMEDSVVGSPYFYIAGYGGEPSISYKNVAPLRYGRWETGAQWNGAVLPLDELPDGSADEAGKTIGTFIKETAGWFLTQ